MGFAPHPHPSSTGKFLSELLFGALQGPRRWFPHLESPFATNTDSIYLGQCTAGMALSRFYAFGSSLHYK